MNPPPHHSGMDAYTRSGVQGVLLLAVLIVTAAIIIEVRAWVRGTRHITGQQKAFRLIAALLMDTVLLMVFYYSAFKMRQDPLFQLLYWGLTICLSFALVLVAMLDVRATLFSYRDHRRKAFEDVFGDERREE